MLYPVAKFIFRVLFKVLWRWKVEGAENFPVAGPVVVVANHVSIWDPIAVGCALPRPIKFMAKEELFHYPLLGGILPRLGAFPVKRNQPDRVAIRRALEVLENHEVLGMFPEGTRSKTGELLKPHPGAAMIALKARAPVVPVACMGTSSLWRNLFKREALRVRIGKPVFYDEYSEQRLNAKCLENVSQDIMNRIALILQSNQDGRKQEND